MVAKKSKSSTRTKTGSLSKTVVRETVKKVSNDRVSTGATIHKLKVSDHREHTQYSKDAKSYRVRDAKTGRFIDSGESSKYRTSSGKLKKSAVKSAVMSVSKSKPDTVKKK